MNQMEKLRRIVTLAEEISMREVAMAILVKSADMQMCYQAYQSIPGGYWDIEGPSGGIRKEAMRLQVTQS